MATQDVKIRITALDKTSGALRNIGGALGKLAKPLFSLKTALAGVVGVGGMTLLVKQSLSATDALAKTAGKIGTTTEALSALQYAGQLTGVEVNTMNMALQRFTRRASEAAVGTGEAKGALRELGVDARQLVRLPLDQRMLVLADAFENVKGESDRLRLAFKLFDSEGAALVNTLGLGRDGLQGLLGEARALGVVMSSDAAKGVEDANEALFRMQSLFGGIIKQTVAALAPALAALSDLVTSKVKAGIEAADGSVTTFAQNLAGEFLLSLQGALTGLQDLLNGFVKAANFAMEFSQSIQDAFSPINQKSAEAIQEEIDAITEKLEGYAKEAKDNPFAQTNPAIIKHLELRRAALQKVRDEATAAGRTLTQFGDFTFADDLNPVIANLATNIGNVRTNLGGLNETMTGETPSAFQSFLDNLKQARKQVDDFPQAAIKMALAIENQFTQAFTNAITGAKKFGDAMRGLAKSVVDSLIKMLVQYYITKPLFEFLSGALSFGAGGGGSQTNSSVNLGVGGYSPRAIGGPVSSGRPYMVGERGPELFVPNASGGIVPNKELVGGGVTVVQNINVTTGVQQTVRAEIANLLPQISNAAKAAVADSRMRGGGFSKAMVGA